MVTPEGLDSYAEATQAAARRIRADRSRMTLDDAEAIVRDELAARGLPHQPQAVRSIARAFHRSPGWALRRRFRTRGDGSSVPLAVEDLANTEAWRLCGSGIGPLAAGLEPAHCVRRSRGSYWCVAEVGPAGRTGGRAEISITRRRGGSYEVEQAALRQT